MAIDDDASKSAISAHARHVQLSTSSPTLSLASAPRAAFEVTTLADVVDAGDGVLSLREAVAEANAAPGFDSITFADDLRGGTITLTEGDLVITDDLAIDGDPLDGGPSGITVNGGVFGDNINQFGLPGFTPFSVTDAALSLQDMTILEASGIAVNGSDADLGLERTLVDSVVGPRGSTATGILLTAGTLALVDSTINGSSGETGTGIVMRDNADVIVANSAITDNAGEFGAGITGSGNLAIVDSTIAGNLSLDGSAGIDLDGRLTIDNSTIAGNGAVTPDLRLSGGIAIFGEAIISNSTFANNAGAGITIGRNTQATILNSTITGNTEGGLLRGDGTDVQFFNSITLGNGQDIGSAASLPGEPPLASRFVVAGSLWGDTAPFEPPIDDLTADQVFARTVLVDGTPAGVLADNGGPTLTVALLDDPANPAVDAADPDLAPLLDQRGFLRDPTPDIGAFEVDAQPFDQGLIVTTLDDVVLADGEVSLREAILTANAAPGFDSITFADDLRGGTITLTEGDLVITDDLAIDGDPLDGGPNGITVDGGLFGDAVNSFGELGFTPFRVGNASLFVEDLTLRNSYGAAISATDTNLAVNRVDIDGGLSRGGASGITMDGGNLGLYNATITDMSGDTGIGVEMRNDASALIASSTITRNGGDFGSGIRGDGKLAIVDSTIAGNGGFDLATGIRFAGTLTIENSTIADNGARGQRYVGGIAIDGDMTVVNSTIAGNWGDRAIDVAAGGTASFVNSTITGTRSQDFVLDEALPTKGLLAAPGATVGLVNTIVDDSVEGAITSNGANTFRDTAVTGAVAGDRLAVTAEQLFAATSEIGTSGVRTGVLADNGGPTRTIALLNDPANPAVDAADPRVAPFIDQRGFLRDATPDIGAFEFDGAPPGPPPSLPPLAEKVPLADSEIFGAPLFLVGPSGDVAISFVDEVAAFESSLGVYLVGPDGTIGATEWVFPEIEHSEPNDAASENARPGGGPLSPGDSVMLGDLFTPDELASGPGFGLFLVADGWALNDSTVFDSGSLAFRSNGDPATVVDTTPELVFIADNGDQHPVLGDILHTIDAGSPNPLSNTLNPGGTGQVTSGFLDGQFTIAFEDKPLAGESDRDFNDVLVSVGFVDDGRDAVAASSGQTDNAALDSLIMPAETG